MGQDAAPSPVVRSANLAAATALRLVGRVLEAAAAEGLTVAVAVTDASGAPLAAARMDGATPPILDFAQDKAFTAATMRRSTQAFGERMDSAPGLRLGLSTRTRLLAWGGGLPIRHEGAVVGGLGVSGARDHEDVALAEAALRAEGLGWEG